MASHSALTTDQPIAAHSVATAQGRRILESEIATLQSVSQHLDDSFADAIDLIENCQGKVIVSGMGKAGLIGRKISASLSSTGTPSTFLHPAEAVHGDLGMIQPVDLFLFLSYSGETEEVTRLLPITGQLATASIAITATRDSSLAKAADVTIAIGKHSEACSLNLAPSNSTTAMMALGDALALVASQRRGFTSHQFAQFHPGGSLGRKLANVQEIMRPLSECRISNQTKTIRQVMIDVSRPGRRTGAIMLTDDDGKLTGLFTDSDLAKILERSGESDLDQQIAGVMSRSVKTVGVDSQLRDCLEIMATTRISELPVVNAQGTPIGVVDITDVLPLTSGQATPANDGTPQILSLSQFVNRQSKSQETL